MKDKINPITISKEHKKLWEAIADLQDRYGNLKEEIYKLKEFLK